MTDTMGSYAIAMGDIYEALRTAKRKTDEALEIYTAEHATQAHALALRETELAKRNIDVTKREHAVIKSELKLAVLDAELHYKKLEDAESKPTDSGDGYITYPKAAVDEINAVITSLIENVAAGHFFRGDIPWRLERVLKFLNSYKVNALEEVPGAKPKDSDKDKVTYSKDVMDKVMETLDYFASLFYNSDCPAKAHRLYFALSLLRNGANVTDWEEYKTLVERAIDSALHK